MLAQLFHAPARLLDRMLAARRALDARHAELRAAGWCIRCGGERAEQPDDMCRQCRGNEMAT